MRVNIKKYAGGGGFATFTPIIESMPVSTTPTTSTATTKQAASSILDDDTYKELITKGGLVNDVNSFVNDIAKLEARNQNPFVSSTNRTAGIQLVGRVNELKQNKDLWNDAAKQAKDAGGWGEVAVGMSGEVYVKDRNGKIKAVSTSTYTQNKENMELLTVAQLFNARQYDPQMTGQNSVFNVADNAIGMEKITSHIKDIISAFGSETQSETKYYSKEQIASKLASYTGKKPTQDDIAAIQTLNDISNTPGDYYKVKTEGSSERRQALKAVDYIWNTLGKPAQQKLLTTAAINGSQDPKQLILDMINNQTNMISTSEISPEKLPGSAADGTIGSGTGKDLSYFEILHSGKTGARPVLWNEPTTGKKITLQATGVAPVPADIKGKPIGTTTLDNIFKTESAALVDTGQAYFGDKKIGLADQKNIIYDGADSMRVYMPTNADGSPNYNLLKDFSKAQEFVDANKTSMTPQQINEYYAQRGFDYVQVNNNYQIVDNNQIKPFWVMYGFTAEGANVTNNNGQIKALSGEERDANVSALADVWKKEKISPPTGWTDWTTTYYKGMIAIPYRKDSSIYAGAMAGNILAPQTSLSQARTKMDTESARTITASSDFWN